MKAELGKPFQHEQELREKTARLAELDIELNMERMPEVEIVDEGQEMEEREDGYVEAVGMER